jgi:hypothetical protein
LLRPNNENNPQLDFSFGSASLFSLGFSSTTGVVSGSGVFVNPALFLEELLPKPKSSSSSAKDVLVSTAGG